jgi:branched-chain amino acid transport system substrate-binding protein
MGSNEAFASAPVFAAANLLQVSPCASHPDLCKRGYATFHRLVPNEAVQGSELAALVTDFFGARRVALVGDSDAFASTVIENVSAGFAGTDTEVVAVARFPHGASDFSDVVATVSAADPELVFFAVHAHEGKQVSSALRATGLRMPFLGTDGLKTAFFLGGGDDHGKAYHTHSGADFRRLAPAAEFRAAYAARYPEDSTYSPEAYDAVMLAAESIKAAGSLDRPAVLEAFASLLPYEGVTGTINFDETGERLDAPVSFYQVQMHDGEREMHYLGTTREVRASRPATALQGQEG